jgi:hypothetical protein
VTVILNYALGVNGTLTIGGGTSGTLDADGKAISVGRDWTLNSGATFTPNSNTVYFADASQTTTLTEARPSTT